MLCQRANACFYVSTKCPMHNGGYFLKAYPQQDRRTDHSQIHEYRNWERGRAVSFLGIFFGIFGAVQCSGSVLVSMQIVIQHVASMRIL